MRQADDLSALVFFIPTLSFCIDWSTSRMAQKPDFNLIEYRLTDVELEAFDAWLQRETPSPSEVLVEFAQKSYKVSFTFVENSQAWCVSITGQKDAKFNSGATLTTWADEPLEGLYMAFYKVHEIFEFGVWKTKVQSRRG